MRILWRYIIVPYENSSNTIKKISILKNKVIIYFPTKKISINKDVFTSFYLYEGKQLEEKEIKSILYEDKLFSLYKKEAKSLSKKPISEFNVRRKLYEKELNKKDVDYIINKLKENHFIDDDILINEKIDYYLNVSHFSKKNVVNKLIEQGFFKEKILSSLDEFDENIETLNLKYQFDKLLKKYPSDSYFKKRNKIYNKLLILGFKDSSISQIINNCLFIDEEKERAILKTEIFKFKTRNKLKYDKDELNNVIIKKMASKGFKISDIKKILGEE